MSENPFQILDNSPKGAPLENTFQGEELRTRIEKLLKSADILLFMKGHPQAPMCGFSANSVALLQTMGKNFKTFDILTDDSIRQGLKEYSNWPTFPQLYVKGELVGGNDIISEMYQNGELEELLKEL